MNLKAMKELLQKAHKNNYAVGDNSILITWNFCRLLLLVLKK
jgi:hypothetical protein